MAFIEYVYSIANDTLNGEIAPSELVAEIQADPLASVGFLALRLSDVTGLPTPPDPSDVFIGYDPALDAAGQAALTALVGAHGGAEAPSDNALNIDQDVEFNGSALSGVGLLNGVGFDTFASDTNTHVSATNNPHATDLGNLGSGTLAELNALLTDATLNPSGTPTAPTAHASTHEEGGSDELAHDDLAGLTTGDPHTQYLNSARFDTALAGKDTDDLSEGPGNLYYTEARVTANTSVDSNTTHRGRVDNPHATDLGNLGTGTLAELNAVVTNATLDDAGDARTPIAHATTHEQGGSDELLAQDLGSGVGGAGQLLETDGTGGWNLVAAPTIISDHGGLGGLGDDDHPQYLLTNGGRTLTGDLNLGTNDITNVGTVDGVDVSAQATTTNAHIANTANPHGTNLENLGTGTLGNLNALLTDATLDDAGDARTPTAHATTHEQGGSDELLAQDLGSGGGGAGQLLETDGTGGWTLITTPVVITDHGGLGGLGDDDHPQYLLTDGTRTLAGDLDLGGNDITNVGDVDGVDISAQATTTNAHIADTANPHGTDLGNLGGGTLVELNALVTDATLDDAGDARTPTAHATTHELGGSDELLAQDLGSGAALIGLRLETDGAGGWTLVSDPSMVSDHGDLTGLEDDDHLQYLLTDGARTMTGDLDVGSNNILAVGSINGVGFTAFVTSTNNHIANTANPHATDLGNLGSGTLAELNATVTDATLDDVSGTRDPNSHASTHEAGGTDELSHNDLADLTVGDPHTQYLNSARFDTAFSGKDTDDLSEGALNLYYTEARVTANTTVAANTAHRNATGNPHSTTPADIGAIALTEKAAVNGVATLDATGKIPTAQIPASALPSFTVVADIPARDALTVEEGDEAFVTSNGLQYIYDGAAWFERPATAGAVSNTTGGTDNALVRFDGATGQVIQDSTASLDDSGNLTLDGDLTLGGNNIVTVGSINGTSFDTFVTSTNNHVAATNNPHGTDLGNLGSGTLAELNALVTDATLDDVSGSRTPTAHASTHADGGSDELSHNALADLTVGDPHTQYTTEARSRAAAPVQPTTGAPANGDGQDGDLAIDPSNSELFEKAAGTWTSVGDLTGPEGPPGFGLGAYARTTSAGVIIEARGLTVTRTANGRYEYLFTQAAADTNYVVIGQPIGTTTDTNIQIPIANLATGGFRLEIGLGDNGGGDDVLVDREHTVIVLGDGLQGPGGITSAYESWLNSGNTGTEADFIADLVGPQGPAGPGVPTGGTTGQVLTKASATDFDVAFTTLTASDVGADPTGTAAAAVTAHEAAADPHTQYLLASGSRSLSGDLNLGTNDITNVGTVDGVDVSAQAATTNNHIADTNNPHATDLGNLGTGTLAELNALVTNATLDDVSGSRTPTAHAATHVLGGADEIDGDRLDIDYTPSSYTPATTAPEVNDVDHLSAHLTGINNALGTLLARVYGTNLVFVESLGNSITTSTAFVQKLRLSSTIPAGGTGTYRLDWSYFWNHDSQANDFLARIQQNDASTLMDHQQEPKDSAGSGTGGTDQRFPASGMIFLSLTAGVAYNFDLDFATNDGNSSSAMFEARMTLYRIA